MDRLRICAPPGIFNNEHRKFRYDNTGNPHIIRTGTEDNWSIEWVIDADPDPFLHVSFTITNLSAVTADFSMASSLPITPPILGASLTGGSVSLTLIDSGGGTAELSNASTGEPIYMSLLDGVDFVSLMDTPQSFTAIEWGTTAGGPESFGTPIPSLLGPAVASTIGIELNASLTPGDTAVIVATFVVVQDPTIPEPCTMALLAIGGTTMLMRRKRRRA
jgi:hypothetical protein